MWGGTVKLGLVGAAGVVWVCGWLWSKRLRMSQDQLMARVVAITGCDSGVGYSAALHLHLRGLTVLAMVLDADSSGAQKLAQVAKLSQSGRMEVVVADVTVPEQVAAAVQRASSLLDNNKALVFHGVLNNAGVMVFGETEWQTEHTVSLQLGVNLDGAIRVARLFAPLLRKHKGRLVNVSSHCASLPLPGLSVYAASKAGLQAWSDALRVEWAKYGVTVISLVPGAFFQETNILARQQHHAEEMRAEMSEEAAQFYGSYFDRFQGYLQALAGEKPAVAVSSMRLYSMLDQALLDHNPRPHYHDTPWRYLFYHTLASLSPVTLRDRLATRFTAMPDFNP